METKFPFTKLGVDDANIYFYGLPHHKLWQHIYALQHDLRKWLLDNFEFSRDDQACLLRFNEHSLFVLSNELAVTMSLKLPFRLERQERNPEVGVMGVKRGENHSPLKSRVTGDDAPVGEGEFVYVIEE